MNIMIPCIHVTMIYSWIIIHFNQGHPPVQWSVPPVVCVRFGDLRAIELYLRGGMAAKAGPDDGFRTLAFQMAFDVEENRKLLIIL